MAKIVDLIYILYYDFIHLNNFKSKIWRWNRPRDLFVREYNQGNGALRVTLYW